jgi:catechol 2,3-dioxygenase-like lactoylglutathione lyase family enzyme
MASARAIALQSPPIPRGENMEYVLDKLVRDFESGKITRRELIRTLSVTLGAASAAGASAVEGKSFRAVAVNHISYGVADYARTRDFYADLLGMKVVNDDGKQCSLVFGDTFIIPRKTRQPDNKPYVDHFAITIAGWDKNAVEAELKRRGLEPRPDTENSFHVKDPDGFDLQISGEGMKP